MSSQARTLRNHEVLIFGCGKKKTKLKLIKLQMKQSFYFFLFDLIKIKIQFWNNFKNLQRHHKIIKKRAVKLLFSIARGLFMKFIKCVVEPYNIPNEDNAGKCRNFAQFIFFHFVSKKRRTLTWIFSSPVQRHLRLVANFDEIVKIHSTLGGNYD